MECKELQELLHCYVDGELAAEQRSAAEAHSARCADCRKLVQEEKGWQQAIRRAGTYYTAPELVRERIAGMTRRAAGSTAAAAKGATAAPWRGWAVAASLLLAVALSSGVSLSVFTPSATESLQQDVVASHVRSLQMDHITDVASSDQHTVKPWFNGKLDYAPPVEDFAAEGFPLTGGRLDYVGHRSVAALVYRHAQHPINLFILPSREANSAPRGAVDSGYNVLHWTKDGMAFWAISDLNAAELGDFEKLLQR
jgi:anti-sigma factor RsiW